MAKLPNISGKELIAALEKAGFSVIRQKGSHVRMKHEDNRVVSIFGETPIEALQELALAKQAWIESAKAEGKPVPLPTYRPIIYQLQSA